VQSETREEFAAAHLRSAVEEHYRQAKEISRDIRLDLETLLEKVAAVLRKRFPQQLNRRELDGAPTQFLDGLRWEELFLTTACASGDGGAWKAFHLRYHRVIQQAARYCTENASEAQELSESMMSDLFLPISASSGKKTSKIGQYDGTGSLEGWIKVVVTRMSIDQIRRSRKQVSLEDLAMEPESRARTQEEVGPSIGMDVPAASKMFLASLNHAMNQLSAQEKLILSLYYQRDLSLKEIGRLIKVHESTVSRTLDRLKKQVRKSVERHLRDHFRVRAAEVPQLIEVAHLEADIDLKNMLAE
jgi:RNA polymerase sigma-70 factor